MHRGHLHGEHSLDFIPRFDPIDDRKHKIDPRLIGLPPLARNIGDLAQQAIHERKAGRAERVQKVDRSRAEIVDGPDQWRCQPSLWRRGCEQVAFERREQRIV